MKIAYVHYLLQTGGVKTVPQHQPKALQNDCDMLVPATGHPPEPLPTAFHSIEELGYDKPTGPQAAVAAAFMVAIRSHFGGPCDLLCGPSGRLSDRAFCRQCPLTVPSGKRPALPTPLYRHDHHRPLSTGGFYRHRQGL